MNKEENILNLCKALEEENKQLKDLMAMKDEQIEFLQQNAKGDWIKSKIFIESVNEAKKVQKELEKELNEVKRIKVEYKERLKKLMEQY